MLSFSWTTTRKSFSSGLLSVHSLPSLYLCLGLPQPICRTLHLALFSFMMFPLLQPVKVPLDGIPSLQCVNCTTQLGGISKLAEGAPNPTIRVADKDVKQCRSWYWPLGIPLITGLHLDVKLLTTSLWVQLSSQFLIHRVIHLSNPCLSSLETRVSCGTVSNALHESR